MNQTCKIEKEKNVIGLLIQLQKYGVGKLSCNDSGTSKLVLGHYDNLLISSVTRWLDYSPEGDRDMVGQKLPNGEMSYFISTHYPIKLLFPSEEQIQGLTSFCYDGWKKYDELLVSNPCMTLVLVNLTDLYKERSRSNLLRCFLELLSQDEKIESLLKQLSCCVLPSIGYSDFAILMAGNSWKSAIEIVEHLHGLTVSDSIPVLSTDYMMPVYHSNSDGFKANCFKDIELSIRVNLKPGATAGMLAKFAPRSVQVYRTSGGSDCLLHAKSMKSQRELLKFLLGPERSGNFVIDMASSLQFPVLSEQVVETHLCDDCNTEPHIDISEFNNAIDQYEVQLIKRMRHRRQANSLRELVASVMNVCSQRHNADMREIVLDLINDFTYCLNQCSVKMQKEQHWDCDKMELCIGEFCRIVNSFLADLSRSDCFFMEQEKYSHSSVSSATSLLIAYNQWLNDFTDEVQKVTQPENKSDYTFLVTSGGRDQTETYNAFHFLEPQIIDNKLYEKIPLITHMSEMSLFDFSGTILRSVHECMHFCGIRFRRDRVDYLASFVSMWLAKKIAETLFSYEKTYQYVKEVYMSLCPSAEGNEDKDELLNSAIEQYKSILTKLRQSIYNKLMEYFRPHLGLKEPKDYLTRNIRAWMYDTLLEAFSGYMYSLNPEDNQLVMSTNPLATHLYIETQKGYAEFYAQSDVLFKKHKIATAVFSFEENKQKLYSDIYNDERKYEVDRFLNKQIQLILSRMLVNIPPYSLPDDENEEYVFWKLKVPYITLTKRNIGFVLDVATDVFSETFADVMACKILNVNIEDYAMMHVYEDRDLDSSLDIEAANSYRIPAVLRVCFAGDLEADSTSLSQSAHQRIAQAVECYQKHGGMKNSMLKAEKLCQRIEELLREFKENEMIGNWLLDYLKMCLRKYEDLEVWDKLDAFSRSFKRIRILSISTDQDTTHTQLVEMYYALVNRRGENGWQDSMRN